MDRHSYNTVESINRSSVIQELAEYLDENGEAFLTQMAVEMGRDKPNAFSAPLDAMIEFGMVEKERKEQRVMYSLTEKGKQWLEHKQQTVEVIA